ncbi:aldehyde dehydrogenase [Paenibacillus sp. DYY-L-2]|uniref:aldehyde dehydrogenase n=1 Tax=Paenibacillus sp. DYY-L-2 TaxID=3447013 RepID=UPI003F503D5F
MQDHYETMGAATIQSLIEKQKQMVSSGGTRSLSFRMKQLQTLRTAVKKHEKDIMEALRQDLRKSEYEAYTTEIGYLYDSIRHTTKNLKRWMKPKTVRTPVVHFGSKSVIYPEPYGSALIIGPFNYPFMLVMDPLAGAIAAGNCAVVKPSEFTPHVSAVIAKLIREHFDEDYIRVVEGGKDTTSELIHAPFDRIFFTGSTQVGKIVMKAAAEHLVPVILELGGKSPCIVHQDADLDLAAKRIAWGKFVNTGQTCVAPDYVLAHKEIKSTLVSKLKEQIAAFFGTDPKQSPDFGRIVNERHWERLTGLVDPSKVVAGGEKDRGDLYLAPTLMDRVDWADKVMEEEIFGPILPVLEYDDLDQAVSKLNSRPKPLALYLFTSDKGVERKVMESVSFGGGCVNDTLLHLVTPYLPFGGVGQSGMGSYHGKYSFEAFSHMKGVLKKSTRVKIDFIFPPYTQKKLSLIKRVMK